MEAEDNNKVVFNIAQATLKRINELFNLYSDMALSGKLINAKQILDLISDEVVFALSEERISHIKDLEVQLNDILSKCNVDEHRNNIPRYPKERGEFWGILREYLRLLRKSMKDTGMLMPDNDKEYFNN